MRKLPKIGPTFTVWTDDCFGRREFEIVVQHHSPFGDGFSGRQPSDPGVIWTLSGRVWRRGDTFVWGTRMRPLPVKEVQRRLKEAKRQQLQEVKSGTRPG